MAETSVIHYLRSGDAVTHAVAGVLLAMSLTSWCFLLVKAWVLAREVARSARIAAFLASGESERRHRRAEACGS